MPRIAMQVAVAELAARDRVMARLVSAIGPCLIPVRPPAEHFSFLVKAVIYQQLAGSAAAAIHRRVTDLFPGGLTPGAVLDVPVKKLRAAGLSGSKAHSIRDLGEKVMGGGLRLEKISRKSDGQIIRQLVTVRGIGPWTAQMFLLFQLRRLDVWPALDYGVRKGYQAAYRLAELPGVKELQLLGERFRPYRSLAAWYCWRVLDQDGAV